MNIKFSSNCPYWVKQRVIAAQIVFGHNPVKIAQSLLNLTVPSVENNDMPYAARVNNAPMLFALHNLCINYEDDINPWMSISQQNKETNNELVFIN